jgi:hypothetical protein
VEAHRTPGRWRETIRPNIREASWSAPALWRFLRGQMPDPNIKPCVRLIFHCFCLIAKQEGGKSVEQKFIPLFGRNFWKMQYKGVLGWNCLRAK